jgi:hypothetical protein
MKDIVFDPLINDIWYLRFDHGSTPVETLNVESSTAHRQDSLTMFVRALVEHRSSPWRATTILVIQSSNNLQYICI